MREDLRHLQQEVKETQEKPIKHTSRLKEIAYGIKVPREETPRERTMRLYPHLMPTRAQVKQEKRRIGITSFGSPGVKEYWNSLLVWSKARWPYLAGGGILYFGLLAAILSRK